MDQFYFSNRNHSYLLISQTPQKHLSRICRIASESLHAAAPQCADTYSAASCKKQVTQKWLRGGLVGQCVLQRRRSDWAFAEMTQLYQNTENDSSYCHIFRVALLLFLKKKKLFKYFCNLKPLYATHKITYAPNISDNDQLFQVCSWHVQLLKVWGKSKVHRCFGLNLWLGHTCWASC